MNYEETVAYIEDVPRFTSKTSLDHTRLILEELGNPDQGLRIIHVAGTNGKGSVCAYLNSMLTEGGYKVGLFTSPHLIRTNERFMINGVPVEDTAFCTAFDRVMEASRRVMDRGESHPTYFEILLLMGLVIFQEEQVDYVVLETGLGGRLDATNVVRDPLACIIVSISRDHTEYLGETIPEIAAEKAGIIKPGVPVIFDGRNVSAAEVIGRRAAELNSPAFVLKESYTELIRSTKEGIDFRFHYPGEAPADLKVSSVAEYQMMNAALAYFTMKKLFAVHKISDEALIRGIRKTSWSGRMETVMDGVIIDGAHNEDGVAQFVKTAVHFRQDHAITILFSAVSDKEYTRMIHEIVEKIRPDRVVVTQISGYREVPAEELAALFRKEGAELVETVPEIGPAFERAVFLKGDGMLFCVGSLYLAGELKAWIAEHKGETEC
ncbi:MAG: folylpolyglutamate synthase/dihydrofolate synthase family protein [Lachnospiraceae bacterium]|nr:folylpolyglutamate synthase/dihydrofolate synthase family protein [Lachnospiraceae bacterium]